MSPPKLKISSTAFARPKRSYRRPLLRPWPSRSPEDENLAGTCLDWVGFCKILWNLKGNQQILQDLVQVFASCKRMAPNPRCFPRLIRKDISCWSVSKANLDLKFCWVTWPSRMVLSENTNLERLSAMRRVWWSWPSAAAGQIVSQAGMVYVVCSRPVQFFATVCMCE